MNQKLFNKRSKLVFKHFSRKGFSLFAALGKEVLIGVLSVATLHNAKANGIATKALPVVTDSLKIGEQHLDEVLITGSRAPLTAVQSAKIVEIVTHDQIERAEAHTLNDVLKLSTGVDVRQRSGFGVQTDISINGGTFDQITLLLNGVPLSNPQTGHNAADFPVSISDIDHIEILEGSSARIYGSSAFSGAVNIVTRTPSRTGARVNMEGGSFGTFGGDAAVSWNPSASLQQLLSGGYMQSDGGTANSNFRKRRGFYQGGFNSTFIRLNWQAGITSQDFGANTFYSARFPNQYEATRRYIASASAAIRPFAHSDNTTAASFEIKPMLYGHRNYDHFQLIKGMTGAQKGENYHRLDVYGASVDLNLSWLLGKTAIGADVRKEHIMSTAYGQLLDSARWIAIKGTDRMYNKRADRTNTSLFLEHNVVLNKVTISAGIMANRNTALDNDFRFYPGIDISYRPNIHWRLYAGWNKALRVPTFTDLFTANSAQQGNLNLKPERNSTFKIGSRFTTTGIEAMATMFYSRGRNMIDWVYETPASTRYHALNIGKLNNMGFSTEARLNLSQLLFSQAETKGEPVLMKVGYAYIHQKHTTNQPIHRSLYALEYLRHKVVVELSHPIVSHLSASWALRWQQRMNGYKPYAKVDGKLTWREQRWQIYLKADNLTCHRYYDLGSVLQPGLWVMAGAGITL
ncbi:MAG: TonB-dependent receptor [Prevotellaceae bacterium]|nr:TonB-dependent receptor [Prevotellaceae bacterium]